MRDRTGTELHYLLPRFTGSTKQKDHQPCWGLKQKTVYLYWLAGKQATEDPRISHALAKGCPESGHDIDLWCCVGIEKQEWVKYSAMKHGTVDTYVCTFLKYACVLIIDVYLYTIYLFNRRTFVQTFRNIISCY